MRQGNQEGEQSEHSGRARKAERAVIVMTRMGYLLSTVVLATGLVVSRLHGLLYGVLEIVVGCLRLIQRMLELLCGVRP